MQKTLQRRLQMLFCGTAKIKDKQQTKTKASNQEKTKVESKAKTKTKALNSDTKKIIKAAKNSIIDEVFKSCH